MVQALAHATPGTAVRAYSSRRRALRFTLGAAFPFFLAATVGHRLNPLKRTPLKAAPKARQSIFAEARARAAAIIPFIFMG